MNKTLRCDKCGKKHAEKQPGHWAAIEGVIYCQECYEKELRKFLEEV